MRLIFEIFKFLLKIDLRSRTEGKISYGRIFLILGTNFVWFLMLSLGIALSGVQMQSLRFFLFNFSFVLFSIELLLMVFTVLAEFDTIVLNPAEVEFLSMTPIDSLAYRIAKYLNFLFFVSLLSFSFNLPPAFVLLFLNDLKTSFAYLITSTGFAILISNAVLLIILLIGRRLKVSNLKKLILPMQIFAVFLVFFLYQILNRYLSGDFGNDILNLIYKKIHFSALVPQIIASKVFLHIAGISLGELSLFEVLSVVIVWMFIFIAPILAFKIGNLQNILSAYESSGKRERKYLVLRILEKLKGLFFKSDTGLATYELVYVHIRRDRSVMVKIFSASAISVAVAVYLLIFDDISNPLKNPNSRANVLMLISLFFNVSMGIISISNHRDYEMSWVYHFIAEDEVYEAINGGFKVLWHHIFIPLLVIFSFVYLISVGEVYSVSLHMLTTFVLLKIFFNLMALNSSHFPFSQPVEKLSSSDKILIQFFSFLAVICAILFERGFYPLILKFGIFPVFMLMFVLMVALERYTSHILKQKFGKVLVCKEG